MNNWYKKAQLTIPSILYHSTFRANLESIQQRGLDPNFDGEMKCWKWCEKGIYLHTDPDVAVSYTEVSDNPNIPDEWFEDNNIIALEINTTSLDKSLIIQDPNIDPNDDANSFLYRGIIPYGAIINIL